MGRRRSKRGQAPRNINDASNARPSALTHVEQRLNTQHELAESLVNILDNRLKLSVRFLLFLMMFITSCWFILRDLFIPPECNVQRQSIFSPSSLLRQAAFHGIFFFVIFSLRDIFLSHMQETPQFDLLSKIFNGELDDTVVSQQQLMQLTQSLSEKELREQIYTNRFQGFHKSIIALVGLGLFLDVPLFYLFYLLLPSSLNLLLSKFWFATYCVNDFINTSDIHPGDLQQKLQIITGKRSWSLQMHNKVAVFTYLNRFNETEKGLLIAFLKHFGFIILEKERSLSISRTTAFPENDFINAISLYVARQKVFSEYQTSKALIQRQCKSMYRTWHFEYIEGDVLPELISTISLIDESTASHWLEKLSPLYGDNIELQFSTLIVKGDPTDKSELAACLSGLVSDGKPSASPLHPVKSRVNSKAEVDEPPPPETQHTKLKTKGTPWSMVKDFFAKPTPTITWKVATHHGFVTVNYNSATQFDHNNADVQWLFTCGKTDYYAALNTTDIPREFLEYAERGFSAGYRPNKKDKTPGNCISEGDRKKDGCELKIRMSKRARVKHYTSDTKHADRIARLCYFSIFDKNSHDGNRRAPVNEDAGASRETVSP